MEPVEALRVNLAFRTGMLVGTINLARDMGMTEAEISEITHLTVEEINRLSAAAVPSVPS